MYLKKLLENILEETPSIKKKQKQKKKKKKTTQLLGFHVNLTHLGLHVLIYRKGRASLIYWGILWGIAN